MSFFLKKRHICQLVLNQLESAYAGIQPSLSRYFSWEICHFLSLSQGLHLPVLISIFLKIWGGDVAPSCREAKSQLLESQFLASGPVIWDLSMFWVSKAGGLSPAKKAFFRYEDLKKLFCPADLMPEKPNIWLSRHLISQRGTLISSYTEQIWLLNYLQRASMLPKTFA